MMYTYYDSFEDLYYVWDNFGDALVAHFSFGYLVKLNNYFYVDGNTTIFYNTYLTDASTFNNIPDALDFGVSITVTFIH